MTSYIKELLFNIILDMTYSNIGGVKMIKFGIDVSSHQGVIDWDVVKDQIDFAILRCGYGQDREDQDDIQFYRNADACTRLNIPFGVYLYSYARRPEDAIGEANHVLRLVRGYRLAYPVFYDLEDENTTGRQSNETIAKIAQNFCDVLEENDYYVGIYANLYWWQEKLTDAIFNKYAKWIASYSDTLNYGGRYDMWQYTQEGMIEGIKTDVDLNYSYRDYAKIIPALGKNGFPNEGTVEQSSMYRYDVGDMVRFNHVFLTSDSTNPLQPYRKVGVITRMQQNARNPYLIGNDQGWVNDQVIEGRVHYLSNPNYVGTSFSNALSQIRVNPSFENRSRIASLNGIANYQGTTSQNQVLLNLLKEGKLVSD
jgi:GH25 family lysozyme M1 (1,4-beta-N-acetylmuramidase)